MFAEYYKVKLIAQNFYIPMLDTVLVRLRLSCSDLSINYLRPVPLIECDKCLSSCSSHMLIVLVISLLTNKSFATEFSCHSSTQL